MKYLLLILTTTLLILSSCNQSKDETTELTNVEKAEALIKDAVICNLYHPETYKSVSTKVDSAFFNWENLSKFGVLCDELNELMQKQEKLDRELSIAESHKSIYAPHGYYYSEHERVKYNQYKVECNELKAKIDRITLKIDDAINELKMCSSNIYCDDFSGWIVYHKFTSKNGANTVTLPGEIIFICDKDFTHCGEGIDLEHFEILIKLIKNISASETNEDIKEVVYEMMSSHNHPL